MNIRETAKDIHRNATEKGWHETQRSFGELIALAHAELSEALEEYRAGHEPTEIYYNGSKPEGIAIELADTVIRIFDTCEELGIDIEDAIRLKMEYNKTRPWRHNGKKI